ncbi:MAG: hypothetical protein GX483_04910 [Actinomycetaceae bacterium]|nr:hypothetical protein [Actinomycetaceae bacterium]
MRPSTLITGLFFAIVGVFAVLRGTGLEIDLQVALVLLFITLAIGFAAAALLPGRKTAESELNKPSSVNEPSVSPDSPY